MTGLWVKHADTWKEPTLWVKHADAWKEPVAAYVKTGGAWKQIYEQAGSVPAVYWTPDSLGAAFWAGYRTLETNGTTAVSGTELATSSGAVDTWQNWSTAGAGPDIPETTGTGSRRPTLLATGYQSLIPSVRFDRTLGTNLGNLALSSTIPGATAINVFALITPKAKSTDPDHYINFARRIDDDSFNNQGGHLCMTGLGVGKLASYFDLGERGGFNHTDGVSLLWAYITYNETTAMRFRPRRNGDWMTAPDVNPNTTSTAILSSAVIAFRLGATTSTTASAAHFPGSMDLHEVVVVTGNMSDANIERVEGYLAWKAHRAGYTGAVTALPSGHTYKAAPPEAVAPTAPTASLLVSYTPGTDRNDFAGEVGFRFGPNADKAFTWIGCRAATGNTGLHTVKLYRYSGSALLHTAQIDMTGAVAGTMVWAAMPSITLTGGEAYVLQKPVTSGGPVWANNGPTTLQLVTNVAAAYASSAGAFSLYTADTQYVGLDLGW